MNITKKYILHTIKEMYVHLIAVLHLKVRDCAGFTIVLKHRAPLTRGGHFPAKIFFYDAFLLMCLMWCNFEF